MKRKKSQKLNANLRKIRETEARMDAANLRKAVAGIREMESQIKKGIPFEDFPPREQLDRLCEMMPNSRAAKEIRRNP